jgi:putative two-component system response regulator
MKTTFTEEEAKLLLNILSQQNDIVRIVDPIDQKIVWCSNPAHAQDAYCSDVWGHSSRCENCSSLRALNTRGRTYKLERMADRFYLIISQFMCIGDKTHILEIVNDITDRALIDGSVKTDLGELVETYNSRLYLDSLTDIYNRRFLDEVFIPTADIYQSRHVPINITIGDIDHFKIINDTHGHLCGDAILRDVASFWKLRFNSREKEKEQVVLRYGGDEFLIILCGISAAEAVDMVRRDYESMRKFCYFDKEDIPFSVSFGSASSEEFSGEYSWQQLFDLADQRLYKAKKGFCLF